MKKNVQPITGCGEGDIAPYVFLCGDPERVPKISQQWDEANEVCRVREFVVHTGKKGEVPLTAASTGVGGPSTAVLFEELAKLGAHTFIRIGNSGALAEDVALGDYVITTASIRDEGTSTSYICPAYPASAHYEIVSALVDTVKMTDHSFHIGITWSVDGFYARNKVIGKDEKLLPMSFQGYQQSWMNPLVEDMKQAKVLNVEMESSTILTLANLFGLRAGCICTVSDRTPWSGPGQDVIKLDQNIQGAIEVATTAMMKLYKENPDNE
ncbi:MAG: uridine phosphorylase [Kiritimatiellae bacterium]|nr:uridine phosphorylase [Kiritimatiellia bacterium]